MMRIGIPRRAVALIRLIAPHFPVTAFPARKHLQVRAERAGLDDFVLLIGLARMFAFPGRQIIYLTSTRREGSPILAARSEKNEFGTSADIRTDPPSARSPLFPTFCHNEV